MFIFYLLFNFFPITSHIPFFSPIVSKDDGNNEDASSMPLLSSPPPPLAPHLEPKALLITCPVTLTEVWWPGKLVDIQWASAGPISFISIWIEDGDGSGLSAQIVARTPNTGKFVCVLPATIAKAVNSHYEQNMSSGNTINKKQHHHHEESSSSSGSSGFADRKGRGLKTIGGGGTPGWGFKVRICDAHDPDVETYSPLVAIVKSESEVHEEDKVSEM
jgi:hypothetical protein